MAMSCPFRIPRVPRKAELMIDKVGECVRGVLVFIVGVTLFSGCVHTGTMSRPGGSGVAWTPPDDVPGEIERLERRAAQSSPRAEADVYLQLARLYASHRNPDRDLVRAAENADRFAEMDPGALTRDYDLENWIALLRDIRTLMGKLETADAGERKLRKKLSAEQRRVRASDDRVRKLEKEVARLTRRIKTLEDKNKELSGKIEKLKYLDLKLEEKRRTFK